LYESDECGKLIGGLIICRERACSQNPRRHWAGVQAVFDGFCGCVKISLGIDYNISLFTDSKLIPFQLSLLLQLLLELLQRNPGHIILRPPYQLPQEILKASISGPAGREDMRAACIWLNTACMRYWL
jgi:hypothetical protein